MRYNILCVVEINKKFTGTVAELKQECTRLYRRYAPRYVEVFCMDTHKVVRLSF